MSRKEVPRAGLAKPALAGWISNEQGGRAPHETVRQFKRVHEQRDAAVLAGGLDLRGELQAATDLNGADDARHACDQGVPKRAGRRRDGALLDREDIPTGDDVAPREVREHHAGQRPHAEPVYLDEIPRVAHPSVPG